MRINSDDTLFGYNILKIRKLLRRAKDRSFDHNLINKVMSISKSESIDLIERLNSEELIEKASKHTNQQYWNITLDGSRLALATAAQPIKRETAEKKLKEFMERVNEVNNNSYYLHKVTKVIVFGSYLSDKEKINDVDIAIKLLRKIDDHKKFRKLADARVQKAVEEGRQFSSFVEELFWAEREVKLFLKSKSRSISLHLTDDEILNRAETKVLLNNE